MEDEDINEEDLALGGNITLAGFHSVGKGEMVVVKKLVGGYARKMSDSVQGFERLKVSLKIVHKTEGSEKHEVTAHAVVKGHAHVAEVTDRNMFVALDAALKKVHLLASKE